MKSTPASQRYHQIKNRIFYISLCLDVFFLYLFQWSGLSWRLQVWAASFSSSFWLMNAVYLICFGMVFYCIHLPLNYFLGYVWEHRFNLSNQTCAAWLGDNLKKTLLSAVIVLVLIELIYLFLRGYPKIWWIGAGGVWFFMSVFLARMMPNVIIPLFFKYSRIENEELRRKIFELFQRCHIDLEDVYAIDLSRKSKKANALICGFGKNRRVILTDTLIENFSISEIEAVIAHELGHYKNKDILKSIIINTAVIFLSFFLIDKVLKIVLLQMGNLMIYDIAAFPVFALSMTLLSLLMTPLIHAYGRRIEVKADRFSLEMTNKPEIFISMMDKLGKMNLAEYEPSRFNEIMFYDHPPIAKRIKFAQSWQTP